MIIKPKKIFPFLILLSFLFIQTRLDETAANSPVKIQSAEDSLDSVFPVAVIGDLQRTSLLEILIGREQNDPERKIIVSAIAGENPQMVIGLGDMVFDGSDNYEWAEFDRLIKPIKDKNIPFLSVLGNHEYWGYNKKALRNFAQRFESDAGVRWFKKIYGKSAFIFLDSNHSDLSSIEWNSQKVWFKETIESLEADGRVKHIFVFLHHPPYTNSVLTGDDLEIQKAFLPAYFSSSKTKIMFSGHTHTYEHFVKEGKHFVVSGGGGGPRVALRTDDDCHTDVCKEPSPRPFNYILMEEADSSISIKVKGLHKKMDKFFILDSFMVN